MNRRRYENRQNHLRPPQQSPVVWPIRLIAVLSGLTILYAGNVLTAFLALRAPELSMPTGSALIAIWSLPAIIVSGLFLIAWQSVVTGDGRAPQLAAAPVTPAPNHSPASRQAQAGRR